MESHPAAICSDLVEYCLERDLLGHGHAHPARRRFRIDAPDRVLARRRDPAGEAAEVFAERDVELDSWIEHADERPFEEAGLTSRNATWSSVMTVP